MLTAENAKAAIRTELNRRIEKEFIDFVLVKEALTPDETKDMELFSGSGFIMLSTNLYLNPPGSSARTQDRVFGKTRPDVPYDAGAGGFPLVQAPRPLRESFGR